MAQYEVILPPMGEGIIEATIMKWMAETGEMVNEDDPLVEIATDKVDSEIPSPASGYLVKIIYREGEIPKVGEVIAILDSENGSYIESIKSSIQKLEATSTSNEEDDIEVPESPIGYNKHFITAERLTPFVRQFAKDRKVSAAELELIEPSGNNKRLLKEDIIEYIAKGRPYQDRIVKEKEEPSGGLDTVSKAPVAGANEEIVKMDRTRKIISEHMLRSKRISPHVTSMVEIDVSHLVAWREHIKEDFKKKNGFNFTYTAVIVEATAKALKDFPDINVSVNGEFIIKKKNLNIGVATALPDGNLVVPVIKDADHLNLQSIANKLDDLSKRARIGKLEPNEIVGGTFTITNMGPYGNTTGTPIINQPEVAILAVGAIIKKPWVVKHAEALGVGVRDILVISLTYDHRVIDGALGGSFLRKIGSYLEDFRPIDL